MSIRNEVPKAVLAGPETVPARPEVVWDKDAPSGPPQPLQPKVPDWFVPVRNWLKGIVQEEGVVVDLCLEEAVRIVEHRHNAGLAGIDYFPESGQGAQLNRTSLVAMSVPVAIELYKQVELAVQQRAEEFKKVVESALAATATVPAP